MDRLVISPLTTAEAAVELVERKGLGHPDTICDALAETLSRNLCGEYRRRFGAILHHNVDKALLCGGRAAAAFGGGRVIAPIEIYLGGRATSEVGNDTVPVREIAIEGSREWLAANLHAFDADRHVRIHSVIHPGSQDLQALFGHRELPLANDTSLGVGHAPLTPLEQLVLAIERRINERDRNRENPAWGEDVKVMGIRRGASVQVTVACAMIGRHLVDIDAYLAAKAAIETLVRALAAEHGLPDCAVAVNAADDASSGAVYLTVTGTSAEAGDDGQVGRGNRVNGLITPGQPMTLEAAAGKNPVTHVGKLYNVAAQEIAAALVAAIPEIARAQCAMVSRIGRPVTDPALVEVKIATRDARPAAALASRIEALVSERLARIPGLVDGFVAGTIGVF
ncbi:MAG TPA: methionine adenosyltransferase [Xanthobacteraceae bacterium]|nr:methionine adenosyltransferase [Xanthobacteraceae bacterium]